MASSKNLVVGLGALALGGLAYLLKRSYTKTGFGDVTARFDALVNSPPKAGFVPATPLKTKAGAATKVHILVAIPDRTEAEALNEDDRALIATNLSGRDYTDAEYIQAVEHLGVARDDIALQHVRLRDVATLFDSWTAAQRDATIVVNMCDGTEGADAMPGISVVRRLEALNMRFTGASGEFFTISTSKVAMKERFVRRGVPTARYAIVDIPLKRDPTTGQPVLSKAGDGSKECDTEALEKVKAQVVATLDAIGYPLIVKPDESYASYGISDKGSVVMNAEQALAQCVYVATHFSRAYCEQFVSGREFTCLVVCDGQGVVRALPAVERAFSSKLSAYERLITSGTYFDAPCGCEKPTFEIGAPDPQWDQVLRDTAIAAFRSVQGTGYARVDMRLGWHTPAEEKARAALVAAGKTKDAAAGDRVYVLEVNANCGIASNVDTVVGWIMYHAGLSAAQLYDLFLSYGCYRQLHGTDTTTAAADGDAKSAAAAGPSVAKMAAEYDAKVAAAATAAAPASAAAAGQSRSDRHSVANVSALDRHLQAVGLSGIFDANSKAATEAH